MPREKRDKSGDNSTAAASGSFLGLRGKSEYEKGWDKDQDEDPNRWQPAEMNMARIWLIAAAAALFVSSPLAGEPPNIVLLFADDLGYGDLSSYGHPVIRTPNLDKLAREGIRLTSFYSAPSCVPARTQLLLGRYPPRVKLGRTSVNGSAGIPAREVTLAQAIKAAGYRTAMMGKWHLGYAKDEYLPVGKGFDYWFGLPYSNDMIKPWVQTDVPLWLYENTKKIEHPVDQDTLTTRYTERAVKFVKESGRDPFFLYLAYNMPHLPIHTAGGFQGRSRAGLFGDVIETIDWSAGEIVKALRETGKESNTIVVFTSDNGPWLNLPARMLQDGNLPWHAGTPGLLRGAKLPGHPVDGYDLRPFLSGAAKKSPRREFFYYHRGEFKGVRADAWKLRRGDEGETELFNLELDPSERYNRAKEKPEIVARLATRLQEMSNETETSRAAP